MVDRSRHESELQLNLPSLTHLCKKVRYRQQFDESIESDRRTAVLSAQPLAATSCRSIQEHTDRAAGHPQLFGQLLRHKSSIDIQVPFFITQSFFAAIEQVRHSHG